MRGSSICIVLVAFVLGCRAPEPKPPAATPGTPTALAGEWTLVELEGATASLGAGRRPGTIAFDTKTSKVSGVAGCNRFSGGYTATGDSLSFGALAMTKMVPRRGPRK